MCGHGPRTTLVGPPNRLGRVVCGPQLVASAWRVRCFSAAYFSVPAVIRQHPPPRSHRENAAALPVAQVMSAVRYPLVAITPSTTTLAVGKVQKFTARLNNATGAPWTSCCSTWTSSNPSVLSVTMPDYGKAGADTAFVTGVAAGTATLTAETQSKTTGSLTITVSGSGGSSTTPSTPVASVTVSPASSALTIGHTVQLAATMKDASGNVLSGRPVTWASSNSSKATVSSSGLVTALAAGSTTTTATSGGQSGTAAISVAASTVQGARECDTPQPGWIWCDDFETDRTASYFEYINPNGQFARVAGVGVNGSTGMRARYVPGTSETGNLKLAFGKTPSSYFKPVDAGTANYRELYWREYVRNQPGWTGGGGDKLNRALVFATPNWAEAAFAHVWSGDPGSEQNYLLLDPASGTDAAGNLLTTTYNDLPHMRWLGQVVSQTPIFDASHVGQWYCVEAHARLNDPGASNGVFEFWINGQLQGQRTGMNWLGSFTAYGFNAVFFENYWNAGSPVTEERYLDNIVVSTARIGCPY